MLRLADRWVWDFWFADDGPDRHVFYLQAPRALGEPELRHAHATIGHAVSPDLRTWSVRPDALGPGPPGSWDDRAVWTGSVARSDDRWWLFYTGTSTTDGGAVQRIGAATSADLVHWRRHPDNPLIDARGPWYETAPSRRWPDVAWRDPHVVLTPDGARCFITARGRLGPVDGRGAIAVATSTDLVHWVVGPPAFAPGELTELEVPQVVTVAGRTYLLFCAPADGHGRAWRARTGEVPRAATYYVAAPGLDGPWCRPPREIDVGQAPGELYAGKLVVDEAGRPSFVAARFDRPGGGFAGELIDPVPLVVHPDGRLSAERSAVRSAR